MTKTVLLCIIVFLGLITVVSEMSPRLKVKDRAVSATTSPFANVSPQEIEPGSQVASVAYMPEESVPVMPSAAIGVQPSSIAVGETILVSWTSAGMSTDIPCTIYSEGRLVGEGNEGSTRIRVMQQPRSDTLDFSLRCVSPAGDSTRQSAEVRVLPTWDSNEE